MVKQQVDEDSEIHLNKFVTDNRTQVNNQVDYNQYTCPKIECIDQQQSEDQLKVPNIVISDEKPQTKELKLELQDEQSESSVCMLESHETLNKNSDSSLSSQQMPKLTERLKYKKKVMLSDILEMKQKIKQDMKPKSNLDSNPKDDKDAKDTKITIDSEMKNVNKKASKKIQKQEFKKTEVKIEDAIKQNLTPYPPPPPKKTSSSQNSIKDNKKSKGKDRVSSLSLLSTPEGSVRSLPLSHSNPSTKIPKDVLKVHSSLAKLFGMTDFSVQRRELIQKFRDFCLSHNLLDSVDCSEILVHKSPALLEIIKKPTIKKHELVNICVAAGLVEYLEKDESVRIHKQLLESSNSDL